MIDKSYRKRLCVDIDGHIPQDIIESGNAKKLWKYGYNPEYDVTIISRDGTIGQIYHLEGQNIALPKKPNDDNIRNSDLRQKDQKWFRYKVPKDLSNFNDIYNGDGNLTFDAEMQIIDSLEVKYNKFIKEDVFKIINGDWVYIDGEAFYITGGHYFLLQHLYLTKEEIYPKFRVTQLEYYYWLESCYADHRSKGSLLIKNRQIFFSTVGGSEVLRFSIITNNGLFPIMGQTDQDAKDLFNENILEPLQYLPKHLLPILNNKTLGEKKLEFYNPSTKKGRRTIIKIYPSTLKSYDGRRVKVISLNDELGKITNYDVYMWWMGYASNCHKKNLKSKAICGGTAGLRDKGGENYEKFCDASELFDRNELGETKTGLYLIMIPADYGVPEYYDEYGHTIYYDPLQPTLNEYGEHIKIGSNTYLNIKEANCRNDNELIAQKITFPRSRKDAFLAMDNMGMFDLEKINIQESFLDGLKGTAELKNNSFRGDLDWVKEQFGEVKYIPNVKGKYWFSWIPDESLRNKYMRKGNLKYPVNEHIGAFGSDPFNQKGVASGRGSLGSVVGGTKKGLENSGVPSNTLFLHYAERPKDPNIFFEDVAKACIFYSMPLLAETNKDGLVRYFKENGLRGYSMDNPTKSQDKLSETEKDWGGMWSEATSIDRQEKTALTWFANNIGQDDLSVDNCKCYSEDIIKAFKEYMPNKRGINDTAVATMFCLVANHYKVARQKKKTEFTRKINLGLFKKAI